MKKKKVKEVKGIKKVKEATDEIRSSATDYSVYRMSVKETIFYTAAAACVLFAIGYIFYRSVLLSGLLAILAVLFPKYQTRQIIKNRKRKLNMQFKDMIYSLSSAISAGNSVEHALELALDDMEIQYGTSDVFIVKELELMVSKISINQNVEDVLADFGKRSGLEDIKTFASMFEIAKRSSGNTIDIIRQTSAVISDKIDIENEMETMLSGKKMEQKVLTAIPILLVYFLTATTGDFMEPIFVTAMGRVISTIAVIMIGFGALWSKKIMDIRI